MSTTRAWVVIPLLAAVLTVGVAAQDGEADKQADRQILERGRYLVSIAGCNDCHTPRYPELGGDVPQTEWLTGNAVGFKGPWGTVYAGNLRLQVQSMSEADWMQDARRQTRPPMPWFALRDMSDDDLKAIYRFIHSLGPKGEPAPAYVPPGDKAATPYLEFVPKNLPPQADAAK